MNKIYHIALTEFIATVATKGFIIGIVITPIIILVAVYGMQSLFNEKAPRIVGEVAIVDPTGELFVGIGAYLKPESMARRRGLLKEFADGQIP
ncbi:MAG: hypothetical protein QGH75_09440, partial [Pseudomonadales bacterium]|nr:hypothetical protein [Pseudomonadales bacterium]